MFGDLQSRSRRTKYLVSCVFLWGNGATTKQNSTYVDRVWDLDDVYRRMGGNVCVVTAAGGFYERGAPLLLRLRFGNSNSPLSSVKWF